MEYQPRHAQPFTLAEACQLDPPIITEEIARLQNSLQHLRKTQDEIRKFIEADRDPDPELVEAKQENETVIGSQEERINILRLALIQKGVILPSSHYDLAGEKQAVVPGQQEPDSVEQAEPSDEDGGVTL